MASPSKIPSSVQDLPEVSTHDQSLPLAPPNPHPDSPNPPDSLDAIFEKQQVEVDRRRTSQSRRGRKGVGSTLMFLVMSSHHYAVVLHGTPESGRVLATDLITRSSLSMKKSSGMLAKKTLKILVRKKMM